MERALLDRHSEHSLARSRGSISVRYIVICLRQALTGLWEHKDAEDTGFPRKNPLVTRGNRPISHHNPVIL